MEGINVVFFRTTQTCQRKAEKWVFFYQTFFLMIDKKIFSRGKKKKRLKSDNETNRPCESIEDVVMSRER